LRQPGILGAGRRQRKITFHAEKPSLPVNRAVEIPPYMNSTPFFPQLRARLAALGQRTAGAVRQFDLLALAEHFRDLLPPALLASEDHGPGSRDRVYSLRLTFQCFVWQMLKPGTACREVVRAVQGLFQSQGWGPVDAQASPYLQARQRLPESRLVQALESTAQVANDRAGGQGYLHGRPVIVADSSTVQLADTPENQALYPQPSSQQPGCGFPLLKFLPLFSLSSGAISHVVTADWKNHDARLLHQAGKLLAEGDVLLVDRAFGDYVNLATLPQRGVDVVARMHGARKVDFRQAKQRLGPQDALFEWRKGYQQSDILTDQEWRALPEQITVRVIRFAAQIRGCTVRLTLVTTLLDPSLYPAKELIALYRRRWQLELTLRHLKTTMGMEQLRCQSPARARKELLACLVAYNLIRCLMAEAVAQTGAELERLSFKGTVDAVRTFTAEIRAARSRKKREQLWAELIRTIVSDKVPPRPGRTEPRAVKRRPKAYPLLNRPRHQFKEIPHRSRYRKAKSTQKPAKS